MNETPPKPSENPSEPLTLPPPSPNERWLFLRDVLVFQLKMLIDNARDFALIPVSLGAAVGDLIFKGKREGALFYSVLRWGAHSEEMIDVYSPLRRQQVETIQVNPNFTVDSLIARVEGVLIREYEKGGNTASIKLAMDRALDQLHHETDSARQIAEDAVARTSSKLRSKFERGPRDETRP
ncbi:MAG: hypothetical protein ACR2HH_13010 [Chthoniobacterales bacterium]